MNSWRLKPITEKQKEEIKYIMEFSQYAPPVFKGMTRGEASDYINKYGQMAHESTWGIENGYN